MTLNQMPPSPTTLLTALESDSFKSVVQILDHPKAIEAIYREIYKLRPLAESIGDQVLEAVLGGIVTGTRDIQYQLKSIKKDDHYQISYPLVGDRKFRIILFFDGSFTLECSTESLQRKPIISKEQIIDRILVQGYYPAVK